MPREESGDLVPRKQDLDHKMRGNKAFRGFQSQHGQRRIAHAIAAVIDSPCASTGMLPKQPPRRFQSRA